MNNQLFLNETYFMEASYEEIIQESFFSDIDYRIKSFIKKYKEMQKETAKAVEDLKISRLEIRDEAKKIAKKYFSSIKKAINSGDHKKIAKVFHAASKEFFGPTKAINSAITMIPKLGIASILTLVVYGIMTFFYYLISSIFMSFGVGSTMIPLLTIITVSIFVAPVAKEIAKFIAIKGNFLGTYLCVFDVTSIMFLYKMNTAMIAGKVDNPGLTSWAFMYASHYLANYISTKTQKKAIQQGKPLSGIYSAVIKTAVISMFSGVGILLSFYEDPMESIKQIPSTTKKIIDVTPEVLSGLINPNSEFYVINKYDEFCFNIASFIIETKASAKLHVENGRKLLEAIATFSKLFTGENADKLKKIIDNVPADKIEKVVNALSTIDSTNPERAAQQLPVVLQYIDKEVTNGVLSGHVNDVSNSIVAADTFRESIPLKLGENGQLEMKEWDSSVKHWLEGNKVIYNSLKKENLLDTLVWGVEKIHDVSKGTNPPYQALDFLYRTAKKQMESSFSIDNTFNNTNYIEENLYRTPGNSISSFTDGLNKIKKIDLIKTNEIQSKIFKNGDRLLGTITFDNFWMKALKLFPELNQPFMIS